MKLTPVQKQFLRSIADYGVRGVPTWGEYPPAKKLVELGLARWEPKRLSSPHCIITDEGKKLVAEWSKA